MTWFAVSAVATAFCFLIGFCSTAIKELILALADRVRYGKLPRPETKSYDVTPDVTP